MSTPTSSPNARNAARLRAPSCDVRAVRELRAHPAQRLARRARRQLVALQQHDVGHAGPRQVVRRARRPSPRRPRRRRRAGARAAPSPDRSRRDSAGDRAEQVVPGEHARRPAVGDDHDGVGELQRPPRGRPPARRRRPAAARARHVPLDRVGEARLAGEHRLQQVALAHRAGDLAGHDRRLGLDDRHLRDVVLRAGSRSRRARSRSGGCAPAPAGRPPWTAAPRRRSASASSLRKPYDAIQRSLKILPR